MLLKSWTIWTDPVSSSGVDIVDICKYFYVVERGESLGGSVRTYRTYMDMYAQQLAGADSRCSVPKSSPKLALNT